MTENKHTSESAGESRRGNFVENIVIADRAAGKHGGKVVTRFPPEPNGYLHIGHAKSICLNFGLARDFEGVCHLRFDDTNPTKEDIEYVESIQIDVRWLGFEWGDNLFYASDYFDHLYGLAENLIKAGKAYVCSLSEDDIRTYRGTVTEPGKPSPYRSRTVEENLDLFRKMRDGHFKDGEHVLRARIDMASPNMKMRDPLLYRIRHAHHYRTGGAWCIYPMYDYAHCLSDSKEGITHSICTLEFENNRELYDWILAETPGVPHISNQYEFARLNLNYTIMSKRKLLQLVEGKYVNGWDDPRMPTVAGMRRRGYTPQAIQDFCERIGVAKANSVVDFAQLEFSVRNDLDKQAPRVLAVLDPIKVVITNWDAGVEMLDAALYPHDVPLEGSRPLPMSGEVLIDRDDFNENPPKGFYRLKPGGEVRLRHAYVVRCDEVIKDADGKITELRCTYDPDTLGKAPQGRKVKGAIHWVSASHAVPAEVRVYDRLFTVPAPDGDKDTSFLEFLNPDSLKTVKGYVEPFLKDDANSHYQFERLGFFCRDQDSDSNGLIFNRTVPLRDTFGKTTEKKAAPEPPKEKPKAAKPQTPRSDEALLASLNEDQVNSWKRLTQLGLEREEAAVIAASPVMMAFFDQGIAAHANHKGVAKWVVNDLARLLKDTEADALRFKGAEIGELVALIDKGVISTKIARDVFAHMTEHGGSPSQIVEQKGLKQVTDSSALEPIVDALLQQFSAEAGRYRNGEKKLMGFFVGQVMKATKGQGNPKLINELLRNKLG